MCISRGGRFLARGSERHAGAAGLSRGPSARRTRANRQTRDSPIRDGCHLSLGFLLVQHILDLAGGALAQHVDLSDPITVALLCLVLRVCEQRGKDASLHVDHLVLLGVNLGEMQVVGGVERVHQGLLVLQQPCSLLSDVLQHVVGELLHLLIRHCHRLIVTSVFQLSQLHEVPVNVLDGSCQVILVSSLKVQVETLLLLCLPQLQLHQIVTQLPTCNLQVLQPHDVFVAFGEP
mmetsp:Transcript_20352/g.47566  ORF Transcript_20352/g.47566 Transcript_20352/m.47566 type:complete len:234 (-) Transcript_20352:1029-1730(-)